MDNEYRTFWEFDERLLGRIVPDTAFSIPESERTQSLHVVARVQYRVYEGPKKKKVFTTFNWGCMEAFVHSGWKPHYSFDGTSEFNKKLVVVGGDNVHTKKDGRDSSV